ncbi:MAG: SUMF1/EgtB/PvdO family nonheme iron enzyme [Symploca sp. SIO2E6]|nr:SUMF1/EgtB/PvdO family nonheme iron enzyme [Symploca sp. SIO2E6]
MGWYVNNKWLSDISEFTFDLSAPVGHLPVGWTFYLGGVFPRREESVLFSDLANRLLSCKINNLETESKFSKYDIENSLENFDFNTVIVNRKGKIVKIETKQVKYFVEKLSDNKSLEMIAIPGGEFMMGSPKGEGNDREQPQHEVTVQPFFIGKYPVTQAQWRLVANLAKVNRDLNPDPSQFKGDNRPVERVSWNETVEFCARLSKLTGREYRLPSEAEWEYACRAGTTTPFCFGETLTPNLAIYGSNRSGWHSIDYNTKKATDSPKFFNKFGLLDMHGTVWEWCADAWHINYNGALSDGSVWMNENYNKRSFESQVVVRGGSWGKPSENCRSAYRNSETPNYKSEYNGFRIVCAMSFDKPKFILGSSRLGIDWLG